MSAPVVFSTVNCCGVSDFPIIAPLDKVGVMTPVSVVGPLKIRVDAGVLSCLTSSPTLMYLRSLSVSNVIATLLPRYSPLTRIPEIFGC